MAKDYNPTSVKETELVDQHGNKGYNLFFEGEDKPVFMMAKNAPEVGKVEFGEIVDTPKKNGEGTYRKFVRKQREEAQQTQPTQPANTANTTNVTTYSFGSDDRQDSIVRQSALKSAVATGEQDLEKILSIAEDFYTWLQSVNTEVVTEKEEVPAPTDEDNQLDADEINLDEIPF